MVRAYVLMTAMPPTRGHLALIEYAAQLGDSVEVYLQTQPGEPFVQERYDALSEATAHMHTVNIHRMHKLLPQEPTEDDEAIFWDMWAGFLTSWGITSDDYIVGSENYCVHLAEITGATFMPYDMDRTILSAKATKVRQDPKNYFAVMIPEFQKYLRKRITIFGAESTGKTTLSEHLALDLRTNWFPEWARPYLEAVGSEITHEKMVNIWKGQAALQNVAEKLSEDSPFIIQDTDLYSTVGYWIHNTWKIAGPDGRQSFPPKGLERDARAGMSDLYIITRSNIPFEEDELRYGGDHREITDEQWIEFAQENNLPYVVLESSGFQERINEAVKAISTLFWQDAKKLDYMREGKEYQ